MAIRRSGLQKEVFALYRRALRLIRTKPDQTQPKFSAYIRYTFHRNAQSVSPRDINAIEHLLRLGRRQIEQLEDSSVTDFQPGGQEMQEWVTQNSGRIRQQQHR